MRAILFFWHKVAFQNHMWNSKGNRTQCYPPVSAYTTMLFRYLQEGSLVRTSNWNTVAYISSENRSSTFGLNPQFGRGRLGTRSIRLIIINLINLTQPSLSNAYSWYISYYPEAKKLIPYSNGWLRSACVYLYYIKRMCDKFRNRWAYDVLAQSLGHGDWMWSKKIVIIHLTNLT